MLIQFSGFNANKRKIDSFHFNADSLINIHFTFNQIYYANKINNTISIFEFTSNEFRRLCGNTDEILISACSDTINFWSLFSDKSKNNLEIRQYRDDSLVATINLNSQIPPGNSNFLKDLFIISTDVNLYLFEANSSNKELRCKFDLNKSQHFQKQLEVQLSESACSEITVDKVLLKAGIKQVSAGKEHILMLTDDGQVYSFGIGTKGQLGHNEIQNYYEPKLISGLHDIVHISTGSMGWHSGALDKQGRCYMWGWNSHGQIGLKTDSVFVTSPERLVVFKNFLSSEEVAFKSLSLGSRHSVLLDEEGGVWTFGWNKYEQLLHERLANGGEEENIEEATKVTTLSEKFVKEITCGSWFNLIGS